MKEIPNAFAFFGIHDVPRPIRRDSPPSTDVVLKSWNARLPALPSCEWPPVDNDEAAEAKTDRESVPEGWWINPLRTMFFPNPFDWKDCPDIRNRWDYLQPNPKRWVRVAPADPDYDRVEPIRTPMVEIQKIDIAAVKFGNVELIVEGGRAWLFRAETEDGPRILKVFNETGYYHFYWEWQAYRRFATAGEAISGPVPTCYGWFEITDEIAERMEDQYWVEDVVALGAATYVLGLMIEDIPGEELSTGNITVAIATNALHALAAVHRAGVLHGDAWPSNIMVKPDGKVVLIDFDASRTLPDPQVNRLTQWREMNILWETLFARMLPDKKLGIDWTDDSVNRY